MIKLNEFVSLVPVNKYVNNSCKASRLMEELLFHIFLNSIEPKSTIDRKWLSDYVQHEPILTTLHKAKRGISNLIAASPKQKLGFQEVSKEVRSDCFNYLKLCQRDIVLDYFVVTGGQVQILFEGSYWCELRPDLLGADNQVVRRKGEEFVFVVNVGGLNVTNTETLLNLEYEGTTIKRHFELYNFRSACVSFAERIRKEFGVNIRYCGTNFHKPSLLNSIL